MVDLFMIVAGKFKNKIHGNKAIDYLITRFHH